MVPKMAITPLSPSFKGLSLEFGWVVYGPGNGYNFPCPRLLMVNAIRNKLEGQETK